MDAGSIIRRPRAVCQYVAAMYGHHMGRHNTKVNISLGGVATLALALVAAGIVGRFYHPQVLESALRFKNIALIAGAALGGATTLVFLSRYLPVVRGARETGISKAAEEYRQELIKKIKLTLQETET